MNTMKSVNQIMQEIDSYLDDVYGEFKTKAQRRAYDHIQENFSCFAIAAGRIEPIDGGARFTDSTGASADFIYIENTDTVILKGGEEDDVQRSKISC